MKDDEDDDDDNDDDDGNDDGDDVYFGSLRVELAWFAQTEQIPRQVKWLQRKFKTD